MAATVAEARVMAVRLVARAPVARAGATVAVETVVVVTASVMVLEVKGAAQVVGRAGAIGSDASTCKGVQVGGKCQ